jgi:Ca2+-binding RTX toxin-like protein
LPGTFAVTDVRVDVDRGGVAGRACRGRAMRGVTPPAHRRASPPPGVETGPLGLKGEVMSSAECLEARRLFAAVTEGFPGYYEITGEEGADTIAISIDQYNRSFKLDGATYGGVEYVVIYGMGGDDTLAAFGAGDGNIGVSIVAGDGDDTCIISDMGGAIWGGAGSDRIRLTESFRGEAYGEGDADLIVLTGVCVDAVVAGGEGNDVLNALNSATGVILFGGNGNDRLYGSRWDDQFFPGPGEDFLFGAAGEDEFHANDGEPDRILGADGFDNLFCDAIEDYIFDVENIVIV